MIETQSTSWVVLLLQMVFYLFQASSPQQVNFKQVLDSNIQWEIREGKNEEDNTSKENFIQILGYKPKTQYWVSKNRLIESKYFKEASIEYKPEYNETHLSIILKHNGKEKLRAISQKNIGKTLAIIANEKVIANAQVMSEIPDGKILIIIPQSELYIDQLLK